MPKTSKGISLVKCVARVDLWGVQNKVIYVNVSQSQLSELGLTDASIQATPSQQNMVVDAGSMDLQRRRFRIAPSGEFTSPADIANLNIRTSFAEELSNLTGAADTSAAPERTKELIRIRDIATVQRGYLDLPITLMRYNRQPAIGISITNVSGVNTVDVGQRIDQRLDEIIPLLQDIFWIGMAMTIMAGLTFGTILTMVIVPTLYCTLFRYQTTEK